MFCSCCGKTFANLNCQFCTNCGTKVDQPLSNRVTADVQAVRDIREQKEMERRSTFKKRKHGALPVKINIARVQRECNCMKRIRNSTITVDVLTDDNYDDVLTKAVTKAKLQNRSTPDVPFVLIYPDFTKVDIIPGTEEKFSVASYKAFLGKTYQQVLLFIITECDYNEVKQAAWLQKDDSAIDHGQTNQTNETTVMASADVRLETRMCSNCKRMIPLEAFQLHECHCSRNIEICKKCDEPVPIVNLEHHQHSVHRKVNCTMCCMQHEVQHLQEHETNKCSKRMVLCTFCGIALKADIMPEHEVYCGSRTDQCNYCYLYVQVREWHSNQGTCPRCQQTTINLSSSSIVSCSSATNVHDTRVASFASSTTAKPISALDHWMPHSVGQQSQHSYESALTSIDHERQLQFAPSGPRSMPISMPPSSLASVSASRSFSSSPAQRLTEVNLTPVTRDLSGPTSHPDVDANITLAAGNLSGSTPFLVMDANMAAADAILMPVTRDLSELSPRPGIDANMTFGRSNLSESTPHLVMDANVAAVNANLTPVARDMSTPTPRPAFDAHMTLALGDAHLTSIAMSSSSVPPECFDIDSSDDELPDLKPDFKQDASRYTLEDILRELASNVNSDGVKNKVNTDREDVLYGGFRAFERTSFNSLHKLSVLFADEEGIDDGGLSKEFLRLAMNAVRELPIFEGEPSNKFITLNYRALEKQHYLLAARIIGYSLIHGGPLPCFFSVKLFDLIALGTADMQISDIVDETMRDKLCKLRDSTDDQTYQEAVAGLEDVISLSGLCFQSTNVAHKEELVHKLVHFVAVDRLAVALNQFEQGLADGGVLAMMRRYPDSLRDAFLYSRQTLKAETVDALFSTKQWSTPGSNRYRKEKRTVVQWRDFLLQLQETDQLDKMMIFATGMDEIPPLGITPAPSIAFGHPEEMEPGDPRIGFPIANTCGNILRLPILDEYASFEANMLAAIINVKTFGLA